MQKNKRHNPEQTKKINRLTLLGGICGTIFGLGGLGLSSDVLSPLALLVWSIIGGGLGGCMAALLTIIKMGLDQKLLVGWVVLFSIVGGVLGAPISIKVVEWIDILTVWLQRDRGAVP
jgi:hypothetical protein